MNNFSEDEFESALAAKNKENVPPIPYIPCFNSPLMSTLSKLGGFQSDFDFESVKKTRRYQCLEESFDKELKSSPPAR